MINTSFYPDDELANIGFLRCGSNVKISKKTSLYNPHQIALGDNVRIDDFCILSGKVTIGNYVHIAAYCGLFGAQKIILEDFCGLSARCLLYSVSDDYSGEWLTNPTIPNKFKEMKGGPVKLGRHVIIGANTIILPNVTLGEGVAVGAMSLVNTSLAPWYIYAGAPVKRIKSRKKDLLALEADLITMVTSPPMGSLSIT